MIDEQSVILTMAFAKIRRIWPRAAPDSPKPDLPQPHPPFPPPPLPDRVRDSDLAAEGVLKDALTQLWEQARGRGIQRIGVVTIRMFEVRDAFRLLGSVDGVKGAEKVVSFAGGTRRMTAARFKSSSRDRYRTPSRYVSSSSRSCVPRERRP